MLAGAAGDPAAQTLEVRTLSGPGATVLWHTDEIEAVAWYGEHELVALAREGGTRGLWRLAGTTDGARAITGGLQEPARWRRAGEQLCMWLPTGSGSPSWPRGRSGLDLYGVRPDGSAAALAAAEHRAAPRRDPVCLDAAGQRHRGAAWILLLADKQLQRLNLPAGGGRESDLIPLATLPNDQFDDLAVAPAGQAAALTHPSGAPAQVCVRPDPLPGAAYHLIMLAPGQFVPGSLTWTPNGQYLIYREAAPNGAERVVEVDTAGSSVGPPIELPVEPAR